MKGVFDGGKGGETDQTPQTQGAGSAMAGFCRRPPVAQVVAGNPVLSPMFSRPDVKHVV